jgi:hypothetical protein
MGKQQYSIMDVLRLRSRERTVILRTSTRLVRDGNQRYVIHAHPLVQRLIASRARSKTCGGTLRVSATSRCNAAPLMGPNSA